MNTGMLRAVARRHVDRLRDDLRQVERRIVLPDALPVERLAAKPVDLVRRRERGDVAYPRSASMS
jgi:hypothetical protein